MVNATIFLVRHADYAGDGKDPSLSEDGKQQSLNLARKINSKLRESTEPVTIWTSSAKRATETTQIIKQEMQLAEVITEEKLWSDRWHRQDFIWLKEKLKAFTGTNLVIVSHMEYVREFPEELGFSRNSAGYASGVIIENFRCTPL
jgi:phosphohistidine phosphatase SixA